MKIIDDFLTESEFAFFRTIFEDDRLKWEYSPTKSQGDKSAEEAIKELHNQQYVHTLYSMYNGIPLVISDKIEALNPILDKIQPQVILRIKLNSTYPTPEIYEYNFHKDQHIDVPFSTAVYYLNTNNGYTVFEDGTKVESVANRLVVFNGNTLHAGSSCTDIRRRLVLNLNYIGGVINGI